jgi:hypothetical protein
MGGGAGTCAPTAQASSEINIAANHATVVVPALTRWIVAAIDGC